MKLEERQQIIEDLYVKMKGKVFGLCSRYIFDYHEREEMVQEIFMNCFEGLERFESRSKIETWLYKVSINRCLNHIRHGKSLKRDGIKVGLEDFYGRHTAANQLENAMKNELYDDIREIHSKEKSVVHRHSIESVIMSAADGFSYLDIADQFDVPQNTVRSRISRGKALLKKKLSEKYGSIV